MNLVAGLVLAAFIPAAAFVLIYGLGFPWWGNPAGWSVLNLATAIALALSLSVWRYYIGQPPDLLRIVVFGWIVAALWGQLGVLLLAPRLNRRRLARKG